MKIFLTFFCTFLKNFLRNDFKQIFIVNKNNFFDIFWLTHTFTLTKNTNFSFPELSEPDIQNKFMSRNKVVSGSTDGQKNNIVSET